MVCFAIVLFAVQLFQGTTPLFAVCCFLFLVIAGIAFNLAGGFSRPSGAYVFFYAVLGVIVGLCWKAVLGEPADSNLVAPLQTMKVYVGGITAMLIAVFFSTKLTLRRPLLGSLVTDANLQNATVGCLVTGLVVTAALTFLSRENGGFLSALAQINRFLPMAMILGVIHQIRRSGGRSSMGLPVLISGASILALGLLGFSKEGIFTPVACWLVAAGSQGYRMSRLQVASVVLVIFLMVRYFVPYSQFGKNVTVDTVSGRAKVSLELLGNLEDVRNKYTLMAQDDYSNRIQGYFNTPQGFGDRLQMISVDDSLVDLTDKKGTFGLSPVTMGFANLLPRFIWPNKPSLNFGNLYAHETGGLADDDVTTGISFSPTGEAYHMARWLGIFLIAPLLWIMLFTVFDSLCGDTRTSPWGLLMIAFFAHIAPEGMLSGIIYALGYMSFGLIVAALSATYLMPIFGTLAKGPEQVTVRRIAPIRSIPRRNRPAPSQSIGQ